jgi:hypothetical protein
MKQALELLESAHVATDLVWKRYDCITALRAAIEQAQGKHEDWCASLTQLLLSMPPKPAPCNCKPRTAPPRQWQGLTDEEIKIIWRDIDGSEGMLMRFARAIEAKLKEKNT